MLEPRLIRLEWCEEGIFEDRPTQNICCRDLGEWQFSVRDEGDMLSIDTGALRVVFRDNGGCFSADNLAISFEINGQEIRWKFGDIDPCNLKGTSSELDMADGGERLDLEAWLRGERRVKRELILDDGLLSPLRLECFRRLPHRRDHGTPRFRGMVRENAPPERSVRTFISSVSVTTIKQPSAVPPDSSGGSRCRRTTFSATGTAVTGRTAIGRSRS